MSDLKIETNGKLYLYRWNGETRETDKIDVTKHAHKYMFETCTLADDVILKDVFLLMNKNIKKFDKLIGYGCKAFVKEGLKKNKEKNKIEYLELYWLLFKDPSKEKKISGNTSPSFHGVGKKTNYGLDYLPANSIASLPLKLKDKPVIQNQSKDKNVEVMSHYSLEYSLGQILYGIIWELSYHGKPGKRDKASKS